MASGQTVFISYAREDEIWAEWIGQQLLKAGFIVELDIWNWHPGDNFINRMNDALLKAEIIIGLFSNSYFNPRRYSINEVTASQVLTKTSDKRFIPILIEECDIPPLYANLIPIRLITLSEQQAAKALLSGLGLRYSYLPYSMKTNYLHQLVAYPGAASQPHATQRKIIVPEDVTAQITSVVNESLALLEDLGKTDAAPLYIEQAASDVNDLARTYNWTPPEEILARGIDLRKWIVSELQRNHNPSQLRDLYLVAAQIMGVLSYAVLDLGNSRAAETIARTALVSADRSGQNEMRAWVRGTQALIARFNNKETDALGYISKGLEYRVRGSALARLYSNAGLSYAALGDKGNTVKYLRLSEIAMNDESPLESTPAGIFYFPRAKLHYYAGTALLELRDARLAYEAERETLQAIELFTTGSADERSYSDELLAYIHLSWERLRSGQIEGILPALSSILAAPPEYRTAWHRWWMERLVITLSNSKYKDANETAEITEKVSTFIEGTEEYQAGIASSSEDLGMQGLAAPNSRRRIYPGPWRETAQTVIAHGLAMMSHEHKDNTTMPWVEQGPSNRLRWLRAIVARLRRVVLALVPRYRSKLRV